MLAPKKKHRLLSIDPSINNLGAAVWDVEGKNLLMYELVHPRRGFRDNEFDKSWSMLEQLKAWKQTYAVNRIICECPEHWAVGGFHARETGSMTKLMFIVGLLYSMKSEVDEYKLVTPAGWKGQLKKEVMVNRLYDHYIARKIDLREMDNNVADAIGIGHYYLYGSV